VSDIQIYDRPLTADEVRQLYADVMDPALLKINGPVLSAEGDGLVLTWPSEDPYVYSILQTDKVPFDWQPVPGLQELPATPPLNAVTVPFGSAAAGLFRVQATRR
jgi:hypothetical protein